MAKKACVFCGREPEGLLSFRSVACGGIAQPACDACREKLKDVSDRKRCALALASGRAQEPQRLKELLAYWDAQEDALCSGLSCLRCGGRMKKLPLAEQWLHMSQDPHFRDSIGVLRVDIQYCEDCGRLEFFHSDYLKQKEIDDSLGDRIYYEG